ncbi:hypothetical protein TNCV_1333781 [Trichonephila clavipes]|nr:hypothetical protein TNCV_1333781 [Trichonephila clavipes]
MDSLPVRHEFKPSTAEDPSCRGVMHGESVEIKNVLPLRLGDCERTDREMHENKGAGGRKREISLYDNETQFEIALVIVLWVRVDSGARVTAILENGLHRT